MTNLVASMPGATMNYDWQRNQAKIFGNNGEQVDVYMLTNETIQKDFISADKKILDQKLINRTKLISVTYLGNGGD